MDPQNPAEVFSRPNAEARIMDLEQFILWTDTPGRKGFRSRLVFGERNGAPRISVFPNQETGPSVISAGMDPLSFWEFLSRFEAVIKGADGGKDFIENNRREPGTEEGTPGRLISMNTLHFGKDNDGLIWIGLQQKDVANIRFMVKASGWHHFHREDGTRISDAEGSQAYAMHLVDLLRRIYGTYAGRLRPPYDKSKGPSRKPAAGQSGTVSTRDFDVSTVADDDIPY